jgi:hypothetical protein
MFKYPNVTMVDDKWKPCRYVPKPEINKDAPTRPKIKCFADLETVDLSNVNDEWHWYVKMINDKNPLMASEYKKDFKMCCCCENYFRKGKDKFGNDSMRYIKFLRKPHKNEWCKDSVCTACFHALKNPTYSYLHDKEYPGILTRNKECDYDPDFEPVEWAYLPARYDPEAKTWVLVFHNDAGYYFWDAKSQDEVEEYDDY